MNFKDYMDRPVPNSKGYLTKDRMTIGDFVKGLENRLDGEVDIMKLLKDTFEAGRNSWDDR